MKKLICLLLVAYLSSGCSTIQSKVGELSDQMQEDGAKSRVEMAVWLEQDPNQENVWDIISPPMKAGTKQACFAIANQLRNPPPSIVDIIFGGIPLLLKGAGALIVG